MVNSFIKTLNFVALLRYGCLVQRVVIKESIEYIAQVNTQWLWIIILWYDFHLKRKNYSPTLINVLLTESCKWLDIWFNFTFHSTVYQATQLRQKLPSAVKDCPSLQLFKKKKSRLGTVTPMLNLLKVFRQCRLFLALLMLIVGTWQNCAIVKCKWLKSHFAVKTMNLLLGILSKFISYVVIIVVAICIAFDVK